MPPAYAEIPPEIVSALRDHLSLSNGLLLIVGSTTSDDGTLCISSPLAPSIPHSLAELDECCEALLRTFAHYYAQYLPSHLIRAHMLATLLASFAPRDGTSISKDNPHAKDP